MVEVLKTLCMEMVLYCACCRGYTKHRRVSLPLGGWKCALCGNRRW